MSELRKNFLSLQLDIPSTVAYMLNDWGIAALTILLHSYFPGLLLSLTGQQTSA